VPITVAKVEAKTIPIAPPAKKYTPKPKVSASFEDDFQMVGSAALKKKEIKGEDFDAEDIPKLLAVRLTDLTRDRLATIVLQGLNDLPVSKDIIVSESKKQLTEMLEKGLMKLGGWKMISDPLLSVLTVSYDEEYSMESELYQDFVHDLEVPVQIFGLLIVPGCAVIALVKSEE